MLSCAAWLTLPLPLGFLADRGCYILESIFPGSGLLSCITTVQSKTTKRQQSRTANPSVDVNISYLLGFCAKL